MNAAETDRIRRLYQQGKIGRAERDQLLVSLGASQSPFSFLFRPFENLKPSTSWVLAILAFVLSSFFAPYASVHFPGVLEFKMTKNPAAWFVPFFQNSVSLFLVTLAFYTAGAVCKRREIRVRDFFVAVGVSRIPYALLTLITALFVWLDAESIRSFGTISSFNLLQFLFLIVLLLGAFWQFAFYFQALKTSSGLQGKSLWWAYFVSLFLAEVVSIVLIQSLTERFI